MWWLYAALQHYSAGGESTFLTSDTLSVWLLHLSHIRCQWCGRGKRGFYSQINCAKCLDHKNIAKLVDVVAHEGSLALAVGLHAPHLPY